MICDLLLRGQIYLATIPFKLDDETDLFYCIEEECEKCDMKKCKKINKKNIKKINKKIKKMDCNICSNNDVACKGILTKNIKINEIESYEEDKAIPINFMNKYKVRPFLILGCEEKLSNKYVYGVPCYSLKHNALINEEFMDLIKGGGIPQKFYVDNNTKGINKPSFIDLSYIMPLNKENLLTLKGYVTPIQLYEINRRLIKIFDLQSLNDCEDIDILQEQLDYLRKESERINSKINSLKIKENLKKSV